MVDYLKLYLEKRQKKLFVYLRVTIIGDLKKSFMTGIFKIMFFFVCDLILLAP